MIIFQAEANEKIGIGNITRTLSLYKQMKSLYKETYLILNIDENLKKFLNLKNSSKVVIINNMNQYNSVLIKIIRDNSNGKKILVTDFLNHKYEDNLYYKELGFNSLVQINDSNVNDFKPDVYFNNDGFNQDFKIHESIKVYSGVQYYVLKESILNRKRVYSEKNEIKNILVSFGGADPGAYTDYIFNNIENINFLNGDYNVNIMIGPNNTLDYYKYPTYNHINVLKNKDLANELQNNDLLMGMGGISFYEAMYLGIPTIGIGWKNLDYYLQKLHNEKLTYRIGNNIESISDIDTILRDTKLLNEISFKGYELIDGLGAIKICNILLELL